MLGVSLRQQLRGGHRREVLLGEAVEDPRQGGERAGVVEVQADDRAGLDRGEGALRDRGRIRGIGAHGWRGTWLVNTTRRGVVRLELDPPARATVCGVPVQVKVLRVSLAEPESFLSSVRTGSQA